MSSFSCIFFIFLSSFHLPLACAIFLEAALLMLTASLSIPLSLSMLNKTSERTRLVRGYDDLTNHDSTAYIAQHVHITRTLSPQMQMGNFHVLYASCYFFYCLKRFFMTSYEHFTFPCLLDSCLGFLGRDHFLERPFDTIINVHFYLQ